MSPIHLQNLILHKVSSTLCISSLLHFPLNSTLRMLEIREKLEWLDRATLLHLFLSPSLRCWLPSTVSWQHPAVQMALLIISGHCYRHPCSSHWPPAGDAGLFCCSTCGRPAARARGSKGMLRSPPAPGQTPAGRGAQTSPRRATTSLLSEGRGGRGRGDMTEKGKERRSFGVKKKSNPGQTAALCSVIH